MPAAFALLLIAFVLLYAAAQLVLAARLRVIPPDGARLPEENLPAVAVLVAARNEEANLPRCLAALAALDYPPAPLTVLIADDGSTDATSRLLAEFVGDRPTWRVLRITTQLGAARGKGNALAQLIAATDAEFLLCCDADIEVPPTWARALVAEATRTGAALVVGTTLIAGRGALAHAQYLDWLRALAVLRVATAHGRMFTGMGNNQLLRRSAYVATGGYEALPFSVTEDLQLFQELTRRGYPTAHVYAAGALAWSTPAASGLALVRQRRRWVRGLITGLTPRLAGAATVEVLVFPAVLGLLLGGWTAWGGVVWGIKMLAPTILLREARRRLGLPPIGAGEIVRHEAYLLALALVLPLAALWPGKVRWKGREL
ncbi:MAG: glycosyltransferase [Hymenobacteraceae bacterium]|nr:glycosyltransferase [Hymenobacteraceae bacterium]